MPFPFLLADVAVWVKLAFLLLPVLALLWRALVGDQDEQARENRRRADAMDRMLDPERQRMATSSSGSRPQRSAPVEAEVVETRTSSLRVEERAREFSQRIAEDVTARATGAKVVDEVEKKFESRHVGHLASADAPTESAPSAPESPSAALEIHPDRMRQAFLLREILRRPEW
jgi:hypothetical protein